MENETNILTNFNSENPHPDSSVQLYCEFIHLNSPAENNFQYNSNLAVTENKNRQNWFRIENNQ